MVCIEFVSPQVTLRNLWFVEEELRWSCMGTVWQVQLQGE